MRPEDSGGGGGILVEATDLLAVPSQPERPDDIMDSVDSSWSDIQEKLGWLGSALDFVTSEVAGLLSTVIDFASSKVVGKNVDFGTAIAEEVLGEWWRLPMAAQAWRNLAASQLAVQSDLGGRMATLVHGRWTGQASEYFTGNMASWYAAIDHNVALAEWVADQCDIAAEDFAMMVEALANALNDVKDAVIEAGLMVGGAALLGGLLGGGAGGVIAGGAVSVSQAARILEALEAASEIVGVILDCASALYDSYRVVSTEGVDTFLPNPSDWKQAS